MLVALATVLVAISSPAPWPKGQCTALWLRGPGLSPGRGYCVLFLGKTLFSQCLFPPMCINGYSLVDLILGEEGGGGGYPGE